MKAVHADFEEFWTPGENFACPYTHTQITQTTTVTRGASG